MVTLDLPSLEATEAFGRRLAGLAPGEQDDQGERGAETGDVAHRQALPGRGRTP